MVDFDIICITDKRRQSRAVITMLFALPGDSKDEQSERLLREGPAGVWHLRWWWAEFRYLFKGTRVKRGSSVSYRYSQYPVVQVSRTKFQVSKLHQINVSMPNTWIVVWPDVAEIYFEDESENTFLDRDSKLIRGWVPHKLLVWFLGQRKSCQFGDGKFKKPSWVSYYLSRTSIFKFSFKLSLLFLFPPKICGCGTSRRSWDPSGSQRTVERSTGEPWSFWRGRAWRGSLPNILYSRPDTYEEPWKVPRSLDQVQTTTANVQQPCRSLSAEEAAHVSEQEFPLHPVEDWCYARSWIVLLPSTSNFWSLLSLRKKACWFLFKCSISFEGKCSQILAIAALSRNFLQL